MADEVAGRLYPRVYRTSGKADLHALLRAAVERAGGWLLFESPHTRAPVYLGVRGPGDERLGVLAYAFRATRVLTRNRPADETRLQVRYGREETWHAEEHPLGRDVAGVDVTVVLGVHLEAEVIIGLDPLRYHPLPMGISIELKDEHVDAARREGCRATAVATPPPSSPCAGRFTPRGCASASTCASPSPMAAHAPTSPSPAGASRCSSTLLLARVLLARHAPARQRLPGERPSSSATTVATPPTRAASRPRAGASCAPGRSPAASTPPWPSRAGCLDRVATTASSCSPIALGS